MKTNLPADPETCPHCYVGRIQQSFITYTLQAYEKKSNNTKSQFN